MSRPDSSSCTRAPVTCFPSGPRSSWRALTRVAIRAPCAAAVRATVSVYRASSVCAS